MMQEWDIRTTRYELSNRNREDARVLVEHPVLIAEYEPFDTAEPAARTADCYRYSVDALAGKAASSR